MDGLGYCHEAVGMAEGSGASGNDKVSMNRRCEPVMVPSQCITDGRRTCSGSMHATDGMGSSCGEESAP